MLNISISLVCFPGSSQQSDCREGVIINSLPDGVIAHFPLPPLITQFNQHIKAVCFIIGTCPVLVISVKTRSTHITDTRSATITSMFNMLHTQTVEEMCLHMC